jgi:hypothetical protein
MQYRFFRVLAVRTHVSGHRPENGQDSAYSLLQLRGIVKLIVRHEALSTELALLVANERATILEYQAVFTNLC